MSAWSQYADAADLEWGEIREDRWYRLLPTCGPEKAQLECGPAEVDDDGVPKPMSPRLDLKLLPPLDLLDYKHGLLMSVRLVNALRTVGVTGMEVEPVEHATPRRVVGHRVVRLVSAGWLGTIASDQPMEVDWPHWRRPTNRVWARTTRERPRFVVAQWSGDAVCLSPWFGCGEADWRMLLVQGIALRRMLQVLPRPELGIAEVEVRGDVTPSLGAGTPPLETPASQPSSPILESVDRVLRDVSRFGHVLVAPPSGDAIARLTRDAPFELPTVCRSLLTTLGGAELYPYDGDACLRILSPDDVVSPRLREAREWGQYETWTSDWMPIAQSHQGSMLWLVNREGLVRGAGVEGIAYGPMAPLEVWFCDLVDDLATAISQQDEPWATRMLHV